MALGGGGAESPEVYFHTFLLPSNYERVSVFAEPGLKVRSKTWRGLCRDWERRRNPLQLGADFPVLPHMHKPALIFIFSFPRGLTFHPQSIFQSFQPSHLPPGLLRRAVPPELVGVPVCLWACSPTSGGIFLLILFCSGNFSVVMWQNLSLDCIIAPIFFL